MSFRKLLLDAVSERTEERIPYMHSSVSSINHFHEELRRIGAPVDLIQQLPSPVDKIRTLELMKLADWLIVTGSQSNVRAAYSSGTPAIGVGAGNVKIGRAHV